ncbi:MAG: rhodanese-like domain-containing protein [Bacteroidota bacterium]|nr:rhodanese-like domain-containing protein [Bacteroidota bacterium]MDP3145822.1 rhodanese-like domain-containing protein [Bacteroidota bacterium]MDP3558456.1 rhodanese-like domain-containing protein [Bacteroidota bacterium]
MINTIKNILGLGPKVDYKELLKNGAQIIDVRTAGEYSTGHVKGSINIPLNALSANIKKINKDLPVITCCASGMRSGAAKSTLKSMGFKEVHNGGGWTSLNLKLH